MSLSSSNHRFLILLRSPTNQLSPQPHFQQTRQISRYASILRLRTRAGLAPQFQQEETSSSSSWKNKDGSDKSSESSGGTLGLVPNSRHRTPRTLNELRSLALGSSSLTNSSKSKNLFNPLGIKPYIGTGPNEESVKKVEEGLKKRRERIEVRRKERERRRELKDVEGRAAVGELGKKKKSSESEEEGKMKKKEEGSTTTSITDEEMKSKLNGKKEQINSIPIWMPGIGMMGQGGKIKLGEVVRKKGGKERVRMRSETAVEWCKRATPSKSRDQPWQSYELSMNVTAAKGVNANSLKGQVFLPHEFTKREPGASGGKTADGRTVQRVGTVVITEDKEVELQNEAKKAGADVVGGEELIPKLVSGELKPGKLLCSKAMEHRFRSPAIAKILGPQGLVPSTKRGTATNQLAQALQQSKRGLDWKVDGNNLVRTVIGKFSQNPKQVSENVRTFVSEVAAVANRGRQERGKTKTVYNVNLKGTRSPAVDLVDI